MAIGSHAVQAARGKTAYAPGILWNQKIGAGVAMVMMRARKMVFLLAIHIGRGTMMVVMMVMIGVDRRIAEHIRTVRGHRRGQMLDLTIGSRLDRRGVKQRQCKA